MEQALGLETDPGMPLLNSCLKHRLAALALGDRGLEELFVTLGTGFSTSSSHGSANLVGWSQETEAQTGKVSGLRSQRTNKHHWLASARNQAWVPLWSSISKKQGPEHVISFV